MSSALQSPSSLQLAQSSPSPSPAAVPQPLPQASPSPASPSPAPAAATPPPAGRPTPTPAPAGTSGATTRTFTLVGGTAELSCTGGQVSLDWATPNQGYWVETGTSDSGQTIDVKFRSDSHESELQAWCGGNQVQGSVREQ